MPPRSLALTAQRIINRLSSDIAILDLQVAIEVLFTALEVLTSVPRLANSLTPRAGC